VIYIDTSAAMKLVRAETHSDDLSDWLRERRHHPVLSSVLIEVELIRATRRSAPEKLHRAAEVLRGVGTVTLSPAVVTRAAAYSEVSLRSLDAIHVATAEHVVAVTKVGLEAFVAYDDRLLDVARSVGLPTVAPGIA
jgi:predicted nucleic acid-binding protein